MGRTCSPSCADAATTSSSARRGRWAGCARSAATATARLRAAAQPARHAGLRGRPLSDTSAVVDPERQQAVRRRRGSRRTAPAPISARPDGRRARPQRLPRPRSRPGPSATHRHGRLRQRVRERGHRPSRPRRTTASRSPAGSRSAPRAVPRTGPRWRCSPTRRPCTSRRSSAARSRPRPAARRGARSRSGTSACGSRTSTKKNMTASADQRDQDAEHAEQRAHARDIVEAERRRISCVNAAHAAVTPSETSTASPSPARMPRLTIRCMIGFCFGGVRFQMASSAARRFPIQPSPVSSTPARPIEPDARARVDRGLDRVVERRARPGPGTLAEILSNSVCSVCRVGVQHEAERPTRPAAAAGTARGS